MSRVAFLKKFILTYLPIILSTLTLLISFANVYYSFIKSDEEVLNFSVFEIEKNKYEPINNESLVEVGNMTTRDFIRDEFHKFLFQEKKQEITIYNNSKQDITLKEQNIYVNLPVTESVMPKLYSLNYCNVNDFSVANKNGENVELPIVIEANSYITIKYTINSNIIDFEIPKSEKNYFKFQSEYLNQYISSEVVSILNSSDDSILEKFDHINRFQVFKYEFISAKNEKFDFYTFEKEGGYLYNLQNDSDFQKLLD